MKPFDYEAAIARLPRWMLLLAFAGLPAAFWLGGVTTATGFLAGALLGYVNYWIIERAVNRLARKATGAAAGKPGGGTGVLVFIQFGALALVAFGILAVSGIHLMAAFWGFFVCPAAILVEILYELSTYGHS